MHDSADNNPSFPLNQRFHATTISLALAHSAADRLARLNAIRSVIEHA